MSEELKPCPFCGHEFNYPEWDECVYPKNRERTLWQVVCSETDGGCNFDGGGQYYLHKSGERAAVAVRLIPLSA